MSNGLDLRLSNDTTKSKLVSNDDGKNDAKKRAENFLVASLREGVPVKACRAIAGEFIVLFRFCCSTTLLLVVINIVIQTGVNSPNNRGGEAGVGVAEGFMRPCLASKPKESHRQHCIVEILGQNRNLNLLVKPLLQKVEERKNLGEECTEVSVLSPIFTQVNAVCLHND